MDKKSQPLVTAVVFVLTLVVGGWYIRVSPFGYTESAILFLAGVVGAGFCWLSFCLRGGHKGGSDADSHEETL